jgi:hypothetical protein
MKKITGMDYSIDIVLNCRRNNLAKGVGEIFSTVVQMILSEPKVSITSM